METSQNALEKNFATIINYAYKYSQDTIVTLCIPEVIGVEPLNIINFKFNAMCGLIKGNKAENSQNYV